MSDCESLQTVAWVLGIGAAVFVAAGLFVDRHSRRVRASLAMVQRVAARQAASWELVNAGETLATAVRAYRSARVGHDAKRVSDALDALEEAQEAYDWLMGKERERVLASLTPKP